MIKIVNKYTGVVVFEAETESHKDAVEQAVKNDVPLRALNLKEMNLSGIDLSGQNMDRVLLKDANLEGAILRGCSLRGANLKRANLKKCILAKSDLSGANLEGANLEDSNLKHVNFQWACLEWANLRNVKFKEAYFKDANLGETVFADSEFGREMVPPHAVRYKDIFETLKKSLAENGWMGIPLVIEGNQLLTGSHRFFAARALGWNNNDIPTIDLADVFAEAAMDYYSLFKKHGKPMVGDNARWNTFTSDIPFEIRRKYGLKLTADEKAKLKEQGENP